MRVKPVDPTLTIRDPQTGQPLPAEGAEVPESNFWVRRLLHGDVVRCEEQAAPTGSEPVRPLTTRGGK